MSTLIFTKNRSHNVYYGPLLSQHVRTILESGLLLDEDYEVLLKASNFKIFPAKATKLPLGLIASILTTVGSIIVAKRCDLLLVVFPPSAVTFGLLCWELKSMVKQRRHQEISRYLVQLLIRLQKLNSTIIRYTKLRAELSSTKEKEILLSHENFKGFIIFLVEKYRDFSKTCLQELEFLANLTGDELINDFKGFKQMNIESVLFCDHSSFNDYISITLKIQDVYIFLSSKFLNYLALTFCKNLRVINKPELKFLYDKKLPCINEIVDKLHAEIQFEFNNLRYSSTKKVEIDTQTKRSLNRHVSGKLQQTLISAVNNLSIIIEKSQTILPKVENAENENDVKKVEGALCDLRDHAFATYESLNILCKLYGIFAEGNRLHDKVKTVTKSLDNDLKQDVQTVNYDDAVNPMEENYELFIPKNDVPNPKESETYVDQSGIYLNLMLKELQQSLKQHERFLAARDKRGIKEEDEERSNNKVSNISKEREKITLKFDLTALNPNSELGNTELESKLPPVPPPRVSKLPPPPPPPPPPSFNLSNLEGDDTGRNKKSLLENIRTLSSQLPSKEDVFGSDDDD